MLGKEELWNRRPDIQVPLATQTGWNLRRAGFAEDDASDPTGSFIPFALTWAERLAAGDPRKSLEERCKNHDHYVKAIRHAAKKLVKKRFLLEEDAERIVAAAEASDVGK